MNINNNFNMDYTFSNQKDNDQFIELSLLINPEIVSTNKIIKNRTYYQWLAKHQIPEVSVTNINKLKINELKKVTISNDEWWKKYCKIIFDSHWICLDISEIKKELSLRGVRPKGSNFEELILQLESEKHRNKEPELDFDQKTLLDATEKHILVHAGPGAGKTTALCALAAKKLKEGCKRIVFVVYTKAAQKSIEEKIRKYGLTITPRRLMTFNKNTTKGEIFVVTFHQYAYQRVPSKSSMESYRTTLSSGIDAGLKLWEKWDLFIVDEIQDITSEHEPLLLQIEKVSTQTIYAGDARQQIFSGASFMPKIWVDDKYIKYYLRYNHRSHPDIVKLLNLYSKTHFGDYHLEQISDPKYLNIDDPITGISVDEKDKSYQTIGILAADMCSKNNNNSKNYVITPITTKKFKGTAEIVSAFRERIFNNKAPYAKVLESGISIYNPNEKVTNIGSSYLLKGTEADLVVVLQADIPYDKMIAPRLEIARLVYVALSRAKTNLKVIANGILESDSLLKCVAHLLKLKTGIVEYRKKERIIDTLCVTEDLLDYDYSKINTREIFNIEVTPLPKISLKAPDFLGLLVEGHIANKLGLNPPNKCKIKRINWGISSSYILDEELIVQIPNNSRLKEFKLEGHDEYNLAQIRYSIQADQIWTLGKEFAQDEFNELKDYIEVVNQKLGTAVNRGKRHEMIIKPHRAPWIDKVGVLVGITDIETEKYVIEIKHAQPQPKHITQVLVYASMTGKQPVLINTKTGFIRLFETKLDPEYLSNFSRAVLASKQALGSRINNKNPIKIIFDSIPDLMISVDVEHTSNKKVLEIGAVAFSRGTGMVVSVYHKIADGVIINEDLQKPIETYQREESSSSRIKYEGVDKLCGFIKSDITSGSSDDLIADFKEWLTNLGGCVILQWAGSDAKILKLGVINSVDYKLGGKIKNEDTKLYISMDVRNYFMRWLDLGGVSRKDKTKLIDAVEQLIFKDYFAPHRAFEDAVATMGVYLAMT